MAKQKHNFVRSFWKFSKNILITGLIICLLLVMLLLAINIYMIKHTESKVYSPEQSAEQSAENNINYDAILVLGAGIYGDQPTPFLQKRLDTAVALYKNHRAPKIIMSGDHSGYHNEVSVMKDYAVSQGVPSADIFLDHYGYSTYDSFMRAKEVFGIESVIIVTQEYHLYRSIYLAESLEMNAIGVACDLNLPNSERVSTWQIREILGRAKDFFFSIMKPPTYKKSEPISLQGNGDSTNQDN